MTDYTLQTRLWKLVIHSLLIFGSIMMLFPFAWMISTSLKGPDSIMTESVELIPRRQETAEISGWVKPVYKVSVNDTKRRMALTRTLDKGLAEFTDPANPAQTVTLPLHDQTSVRPVSLRWDNYPEAWKSQPFGRYFLNTIIVAIITVGCQLFFSSLAAYAFAFFRFPFKNALFIFLLGTMMLPQQALLVPNYVILAKLRWLDTYLALIVPFTASVYSVFFFRQFFLTLPRDLHDAATVDGCSHMGFYFRVLLPLSAPPFLTLGIFSFLGSWNSFIWPLIVTNSTHLRVLQVGLAYFLSDAGTEWGLLMAASTFSIVPLVIGYFFVQKKFVESQAMTGLKE
ncbi:carbohydrate ABC transporter permease [bacterium]|nr:carbohydrate ABC transporter permease [candidate division CSSED10-310 bacterium]